MAVLPESVLQSAPDGEILSGVDFGGIRQPGLEYLLKVKEIHQGPRKTEGELSGGFRGDLSREGCISALFLRISFYGPSDLLSPLYDASRAPVTWVR